MTWEQKQNKVYDDFLENKIVFKKVIEYCGLNWHKERFNNLTEQQYKQQVIDDYKNIGVDCNLVWDYELEWDPEAVKYEVLEFIGEKQEIDLMKNIKNTTGKCIICKTGILTTSEYICNKCKQKQEEKYKDCIEDEDYVTCAICTAKRESLTKHIAVTHKIPTLRYKKFYKVDTISNKFRNKVNSKVSESVKKLWDDGHYKKNYGYSDINNEEQLLTTTFKNLIFTGGNRKGYDNFYLTIEKIQKRPDFVIVEDSYLQNLDNKQWYEKEEQVFKDFVNKQIEIKKVVQYCGFLWHQNKFNGRTKEQYEKNMIEEFSKIGIECLVIWTNEIKQLPKLITRVTTFIAS